MSASLPEPVRALLRFHRHDLAGRIQVILAAIELGSVEEGYQGGAGTEAVSLLRDVERSWRVELARCDQMLSGGPAPFPVDSHQLSEVLGTVVPSGRFRCDPEALARSLRHGHKAIGRASLYAHTTKVEQTPSSLMIDLRSGACEGEPADPLHVVLAGDGDASLCVAEARLAGVAVSASRDDDGVIIRFTVPVEGESL